ncbi:conserved uncharacterized protein, DUF1841 [Desulfosarcina variabilis str. Montpellier]|uniref:hypothetical protein n=1 Tax=Desulfosarcina variabilis TaxID=2300 RepID=UPI003AFB025D
MEDNKYLKYAILEIVENQLEADDPPETRKTLDRLMSEGYSEEDAMELIACVVTSEIFDVMKNQKPYDHIRFVKALNDLPKIPDD